MTGVIPVKLAFVTIEPEGGAGEKPPVIFVHGLTTCKECWSDIPQTVANATKRKTYNIDLRNHGESEWSDVWNFDCNVDDLLHFMDCINASKAIIVGHSMGGIACMHTALRCPERIEKLVVEDIGIKKFPKEMVKLMHQYLGLLDKSIDEMPAGLDEDEAYTFMSEYAAKHVPPEIMGLRKHQPLYRNSCLLKPTEDGGYKLIANMPVLLKNLQYHETIMSEPKGVCEAPTGFICGTDSDFQVGQELDKIKEHFPKTEYFAINDATHWVHGDKPQEFIDVLLKFILKE